MFWFCFYLGCVIIFALMGVRSLITPQDGKRNEFGLIWLCISFLFSMFTYTSYEFMGFNSMATKITEHVKLGCDYCVTQYDLGKYGKTVSCIEGRRFAVTTTGVSLMVDAKGKAETCEDNSRKFHGKDSRDETDEFSRAWHNMSIMSRLVIDR